MKQPATTSPFHGALRFVALAALLPAVTSCGDSSGVAPAPHVTAVVISQNAVLVELMDSATVTAVVHLSNGSQAQRAVQWSCTRPELVATCGSRIIPRDTGSFQLIARVGDVADTAWIRVYEEGMRDVLISDPPASVPQWLLQGAGALIKVQVIDSSGATRLDRRLRWASSDSTVAVVRDTTWWNWNAGEWWPGGAVHVLDAGHAELTLTVGGRQATLTVVGRPRAPACDPSKALALDLEVGELRRFRGTDEGLPTCLQYRHGARPGARYLVMFERLPIASPVHAAGRRGLFIEAVASPPDSMVVQLYTPLPPAAQAAALRSAAASARAEMLRESGRGGQPHAALQRPWELPGGADGGLSGVSRAAATHPSGRAAIRGRSAQLAAGDTLIVDGLGRIGHSSDGGPLSDRAVVRYVGENLVFAEHVELFGDRLRRADGGVAATIPAAEYARIDAAAGPGRAQLDRLFGPAPGDSLLILPPGRELIVNTVMPAGVWGTWRRNMAIIDYWYGTDGVTPGSLQDPLLMTNQLIIHELAHMRHFMHDPPQPTPLWVVEGVARFAEHLAFAAHVFRSDTPSRAGNIIAGAIGYPTDPHLRTQAELPWAGALGTNFFGGYGASAYLFDYLADHAEAAGRDGLGAVRDVVLASASRPQADAAVAHALGAPIGLDELVTRARIALILDDLPDAVLPAWTQYLQYNTRASRPATPNWPTAQPGTPFTVLRQVQEGVTWGVFIDGRQAAADQDYLLDVTRGTHSVVSIVRIQ